MGVVEQKLAALTSPAGGTGFVGPDVPIDLLLATARPFGHLAWSDEPTPWADRWVETSFPFWARSILEQWHAGRFDGVEQVLFSRSEDASQRLYYYVLELQRRGVLRGPEPLILDLAMIRRESSLAYTAAAIRDTATRLGVTTTALDAAIVRGNALRERMARIQRDRVIDGPYYERLSRAALFSDVSAWIDAVEPPAGGDRPRLLLSGSVPPDDRLHKAAEEGGATIVAERHVHSLLRLGAPVAIDGEDAARALANHVTSNSVGPRSFVERSTALVAAAGNVRSRGVILWQTREEEGATWQVPLQRKALEDAGIPALVMAARDWRASDGALDSIRRFSEELVK